VASDTLSMRYHQHLHSYGICQALAKTWPAGVGSTVGTVTWLAGVLVGAVVLLCSWGLLVLLASRLPSGVLRELAGFLPNSARMVRRLRNHPEVPRRAKVAVVFAGLWVLSPIDLIPEFLPVIGPLDDVVVVALALRYAARRVPRAVLLEAWDGDPHLLERLLG
jgi:uncharacterized membrane protein YkvA (DUF1232 family)